MGQRQPELGVGFQRGQQGRGQGARRRRGGPQQYGLDPLLAKQVQRPVGRVQGGDDVVDVAQEQGPGRGQGDAAGVTLQQLHAQFSLELLDLIAERRLRHVQVPAGGQEARRSRYGRELLDLPELHGSR